MLFRSGKYASTMGNVNASACRLCDKGTYSTPGLEECQLCSEGTYSSLTGATALSQCQNCPVGSTSGPGSLVKSDCVCARGYTGSSENCKMCPQNTYKDNVGEGPCLLCPLHSNSSEGSALIADCECQSGYAKNGDVCQSCPPGTYISSSSCAPCQICEPGQYRPDCRGDQSGMCQICPAGTYSSSSLATTCTNCTNNTISSPGSIADGCQCKAGYTISNGACVACEVGTY